MIIGYDKQLSLERKKLEKFCISYKKNTIITLERKTNERGSLIYVFKNVDVDWKERGREWAVHRLLFYQLRNNNYKFQLQLELFFTIMFSSNYKHHKTVIKQ